MEYDDKADTPTDTSILTGRQQLAWSILLFAWFAIANGLIIWAGYQVLTDKPVPLPTSMPAPERPDIPALILASPGATVTDEQRVAYQRANEAYNKQIEVFKLQMTLYDKYLDTAKTLASPQQTRFAMLVGAKGLVELLKAVLTSAVLSFVAGQAVKLALALRPAK